MLNKLKRLLRKITGTEQVSQMFDAQKLLTGAILANDLLGWEKLDSTSEAGYEVFLNRAMTVSSCLLVPT